MLRHLTIRNYTLIESLDVDLGPGLTVVTGETGAGKSIVLDALGLVLGNRADARALRHGAERLDVSASFDTRDTPGAEDWLRERALDIAGECQLRRVVTADGRSRGWINGSPATLADMKTLGDQLVDMHGQHEHHSLLTRATHQHLLDEFGGHTGLARAVAQAHATWRDCAEEIRRLQASAAERRDRQQLLSYQLGELDELALEEGELEGIEREQRLLAGAGERIAQLDAALALCEGEDGGALDQLRQLVRLTDGLDALGARGTGVRELLQSASIQLEEARRELHALAAGTEINPARLAELDERLGRIQTLARKHRVPPAELPALHAQLRAELAAIDGSEQRRDTLDAELEKLAGSWRRQAAALSAARNAAAETISARVGEQLARLGMENCRFLVACRADASGEPAANGAEQIEFLVSTNPGTEPGPLSRIASGGELSRISLAIQVITASRATTPTVIFDEVDVGIGGATAEAVGELLQTLAQRLQVLCVTHLPQVAARGGTHLRASKQANGESTTAALEALDRKERLEEIARMLGGRTITKKTRDHAREMLAGAALSG